MESSRRQVETVSRKISQADEEVLLSQKLCSSVLSKDFGLCQVLLYLHANPDLVAKESHGMSASHLAVGIEPIGDTIDFLRLLLQYGANPNVRAVCGGITPVHLSAMLGKSKALKMLLASGGDPCILDNDDNSAFDHGWSHEKVRRILLKYVEKNRNGSSSSSEEDCMDENVVMRQFHTFSNERPPSKASSRRREGLHILCHRRKPLKLLANSANFGNDKSESCGACSIYREKKICQRALLKSAGVCFPLSDVRPKMEKDFINVLTHDNVSCHCSERHNFSYPMSFKLKTWCKSKKGGLINNIAKVLTPSPKDSKRPPKNGYREYGNVSKSCKLFPMMEDPKPKLVKSFKVYNAIKYESNNRTLMPPQMNKENLPSGISFEQLSDNESGSSSSSSKLSIESAEKLLNMRLVESDFDKIDIENGEVVGLKKCTLLDVSSPNNPFLACKRPSFERNGRVSSRVLEDSNQSANDDATMNHFEDDPNEEHTPCSPCMPKNRISRSRTVPTRNRWAMRRKNNLRSFRSESLGHLSSSSSISINRNLSEQSMQDQKLESDPVLHDEEPIREQRRTPVSPFPRYSLGSSNETDDKKNLPSRIDRKSNCRSKTSKNTPKAQRKLNLVDISCCKNCSMKPSIQLNNVEDDECCSVKSEGPRVYLKANGNDKYQRYQRKNRKVTFSNSSSNPSAEVSPFECSNQEQPTANFYSSFFNNGSSLCATRSDSKESELYRDGEFVFEQLRIPPKSDESLLTSDRSCVDSSYATCTDWKSCRSQTSQKNSREASLETRGGSSVFDSSRDSKRSAQRKLDRNYGNSLEVNTSAIDIEVSESLERLSNEEIYEKLKSRNIVKSGPVTESTRGLYLKILSALESQLDGSMNDEKSNESQRQIVLLKQSEFNHNPNDFPKLLSDYLLIGNSVTSLPDLEGEEQLMVSVFSDPARSWREGNRKRSFNYLLLDPRVTKNILNRPRDSNEIEIFRYFVSAIFYVGKGQNSRPFSHFTEASRHLKSYETISSEKINHIQDIWNAGLGVVNLQLFQNAIPAEAYTREALLIAALGLNRLTNQRKGDFYGVCCSWPEARREQLGIFLLKKAMKIFLQEGEKQIKLKDF